ncbi:uncharacterized protein LOC143260623 [Megalopta genalis]|uniref:uncharacterized protein LOC143260623 n=1 Tax=Megalopta genalis TaxID=115081 RepID=UPI003FD66B4F
MDKDTKVQNLIDTGADICVYPRSLIKGRPTKSNYTLYAANESTISTYGDIVLHLNFGLRRVLTWKFVIADISKPIIGADFLKNFGLLVDIKNKRLIDNNTNVTARGTLGTADIESIKTVVGDSPYIKLLTAFVEITRPPQTNKTAKHSITHHIQTTDGPPIFAKPRRLAPDRLKSARQEFQHLLSDSAIQKSMGLTPSLSPEKGQWMATLRRLSRTKYAHNPGPLPVASYRRFFPSLARKNNFFKIRPS